MNAAYLIERLADMAPEAPALWRRHRAQDWAETRECVRRIAAGLAARGIGAGDRVALLALNGPEFFEFLLGTVALGAVTVPLNHRLSSAEIGFQLRDCAASLLALSAELGEMAAALDPALPKFVLGGPQDELEPLITAHEALNDLPELAPDHTLGIFFTGGTTGRPKGVMLSHRNLLANASQLGPAVGYRPGDVHLHCAPMFHLADLSSLFAQLFTGPSAHAFAPRFEPAQVAAAIARHGVTTTVMAPTMVAMFVRQPAVAEQDLSSLRLLHYGGSAIGETVLRETCGLLDCDLVQGYGQSEATQGVCFLGPDDHRAALAGQGDLLASCGKPFPGVQVRLVDESQTPVAPGEIGEIAVRSPAVMSGYWQRPEETAAALAGGWLLTGDLAQQDAAGYFHIVDRRKDMIVSGGENVYSAEVENALNLHAGVAEAAVIAVPDERLGEVVHAVVVARDGVTPVGKELQEHCRELLGGFKIPRSFEFVESLPKSAAGKVRKTELRQPHWQDRRRSVA